MHVLTKPLTREEIESRMKEEEQVSGVVAMDLSDVVELDLEGFLDELSTMLIGDEMLQEIDYDIVGHLGNTLYILVSGIVGPE